MIRPKNWSWSGDIAVIETNRKISLIEWNNFTNRINEFRRYKGLQEFSFTPAYRNNKLTTTIYNQTVDAIAEMITDTDLMAVKKKQSVTPDKFYELAKALNSIDAFKYLGDECFITASLGAYIEFDDTPAYIVRKGYCKEHLRATISASITFVDN